MPVKPQSVWQILDYLFDSIRASVSWHNIGCREKNGDVAQRRRNIGAGLFMRQGKLTLATGGGSECFETHLPHHCLFVLTSWHPLQSTVITRRLLLALTFNVSSVGLNYTHLFLQLRIHHHGQVSQIPWDPGKPSSFQCFYVYRGTLWPTRITEKICRFNAFTAIYTGHLYASS